MSQLSVTFSPAQVTVDLKPAALSAGTGTPVVREFVDLPAYEGPTEVTPTEEVQTLATTDFRLTEDITVDAIPGDYIGSEVPRVTHPLPSIRITSAAGTVTAEHTQETGYVTGGTNGATLQLTVKAGETITPTESEQTAVPKYRWTTGDVKVAAVPSDYVGSSIPERGSDDLTASGATVTAPAGYYDEAATKTVQSGSVAVPNTGITANPSLSITQNTGRIEASVSKTQTVSPTVSEGYVSSGTSGTMTVSGSNHYDLPTQAAATITPTESAQTAVPAHKWTTGEVGVAAIPSDYVGSSIERRDSTDLSASGKTVTVPAGFFAEDATKDVATGSRGNGTVYISNTATKKIYTLKHESSTSGYYASSTLQLDGTVEFTKQTETVTPTESSQTVTPTNSSYYLESVTVNPVSPTYVGSQVPTLGATTYTPTTSQQTIAADQYLTGAQVIESIPSQFHDMSVPLAWMGVDAEQIGTFTLADVKLVDTAFNGWTASTTAKDILATRTAGSFTATNLSENEYVIVWETKIPIVTPDTATKKALPIYLAGYHVQGIIRRSSSYANIEASIANSNVNVSMFTAGNFFRYYGSSTGTITYTWNTSYGLYATVTANTLSNSTAESPVVTLKSPKVSARCSTTYMSTTNSNLIDQDKTIISQKCKVYRIKKRGFIRGCYDEIMRVVNEVIDS